MNPLSHALLLTAMGTIEGNPLLQRAADEAFERIRQQCKPSRHDIVREFVDSGMSHDTIHVGAAFACPRCPFHREFGTVQGAVTKATEHVIQRHPEVGR